MENTVKSDRVEGREKEIIKMRAKKLLAVGLSVLCVASLVTGCGSKKGDKAAGGSKPISVVTREDGSGTRGAFIELFGIEQEEGGKKVDKTTASASVSQSTEVMMTTVAGDEYAIGYTSLGALNDKVKALKVDGVEATAENVKSGTYKISRPFNIATKKDVSEAAQDFINYIMSADGQKVVEDNGYIAVSENAAFKSNGAKGKIVVAGSSSVTPVMEKLAEAYQKVNTGAQVEVQQSDSTTGMTSAAEGTCDIGMASRDLKDSETQAGLTPTAIALDGVAVIVNNKNSLEDISSDAVKNTKARRLKIHNDIKIIIIDYLQLMTGNQDTKGNREQEVAFISRTLKAIAKELNVPMIALSQLSRATEMRGGSKRPQLSDLRESGAIEQDADIVAFIHRPEYYGINQDENGMPTAGMAEIILAKHRNGAVCDVNLRFLKEQARFADVEDSMLPPAQAAESQQAYDDYASGSNSQPGTSGLGAAMGGEFDVNRSTKIDDEAPF